MNQKQYSRLAWGLLGLNVFVILWGVLVRASGSGAGCGNHWPTCNGAVMPTIEKMETFIEFFHRATTGIDLPLVLIALYFGYKLFPQAHRVRRAALATTVFIVVEALIGAALVRFDLVAGNDSPARAVVVALHLANTFLLLAALTLQAYWASGGAPIRLHSVPWFVRWSLFASLTGTLVLAANGAITALGDTLHFSAGLTPENSALVAQLLQMRFLHPLLAILVGVLIALTILAGRQQARSPLTDRLGYGLLTFYVLQVVLGALNVALQAPIWLQIVHLFLADTIWVLLILFGARVMAVPDEAIEPVLYRRTALESAD